VDAVRRAKTTKSAKFSDFLSAPPAEATSTIVRTGRRAIGRADKQARITDAARKLFRRRGYEATTTQAIAEEADIGSGTLFSYINKKEDLLLMVLLDDLIRVAKQAHKQAQHGVNLIDKAHKFYLRLMKFHYDDNDLSKRLLQGMLSAFALDPERSAQLEHLTNYAENSILEFILENTSNRHAAGEIDAVRISKNCFAIYYVTLQRGLFSGIPLNLVSKELRLRLAAQLRGL
jgi:TetR/AcrR family transcriptional regulator, cholesterol catabolism regulator